jgi:hypothetical protein
MSCVTALRTLATLVKKIFAEEASAQDWPLRLVFDAALFFQPDQRPSSGSPNHFTLVCHYRESSVATIVLLPA